MSLRFTAPLLLAAVAFSGELPLVEKVEHQPLAAQVTRLLEALEMLGDPISGPDLAELKKLTASGGAAEIRRIQQVLDKYCLAGVNINPESRVKVVQGPAAPQLEQHGWRTFLVKVENQAGVTAVLGIDSPQAGQIANRPPDGGRRFLELQSVSRQPMRPHLSGLELEYRILQLSSRDAGKREAKLIFDVGQGSQDLGFRSEADILFTIKPANKVTFNVLDHDGKPTTASLLIRDGRGRVYPSQAKRVAPDFFFHPQVYRASGENVLLPAGEYSIQYSRGPEYVQKSYKLKVTDQPVEVPIRLERWIDPAKLGWISGDHHIHAAGCSHYEKPTEGVYPKDMMRHILGEDLKIGSVLTWGPGWYFQKTFFEGKDHALSTAENRMRYDIEVSGFPSSHTGHIVLLGIKDQDYPNTRRIEDWPSWGIPVFKWAKSQGAITGFAHSGWGLKIDDTKLPSQEMPPFDGIGANEYIVGVTHDLVDFISTVDTPAHWELNIWYHTLNAGFRTRISGETDFPCIYDEKVGLGRSYVKQAKADYSDWVLGIRDGRNYVSDGRSHLINFQVNKVEVGTRNSEVQLQSPGNVLVTAEVAAMLPADPDPALRGRPLDRKPYWDIERARIGSGRKVPVELLVNGEPVARQEIEADGKIRPIKFEQRIDRSSWVALRIFPSSHTNPIFVLVGGKPVRASRKSIDWCLQAVDTCWRRKEPLIRIEERGAAMEAYEHARRVYRQRLAETPQ